MRALFFLIFFSSVIGTQIQLGKEILSVEIVDTPRTRAKGLMERKHLEEGKGMLFVYQKAEILSFWMKNTLIPLSIAFFDEEKSLINILDMDVPTGNKWPHYQSAAAALYALEVPQGWFKKQGIGPGTKFSFLDSSNQIK